MLLVHFVLPIILPETCCSRIPEFQDENVVQNCHPRAVHGSQYADSRLETILRASFIGTRGKQLQSNMIEESRIPNSACCNPSTETQDWHFEHFIYSLRSRKFHSLLTYGRTEQHAIFTYQTSNTQFIDAPEDGPVGSNRVQLSNIL